LSSGGHDEEVTEAMRDQTPELPELSQVPEMAKVPEMGREPETARDAAAVAAFVERFADLLVEAGMPRMPSRIFVKLLATDEGRLTAAELSEQLQISRAAVSGAIRYLAQVDLVSRERPAGSRRDVYRVGHDAWHEALARRDQMLIRWADSLRVGVQTLGAQTPAGQRVRESVEFFEFIAAEMPVMLERWRSRPANPIR
jgi:DNA-binding transcriptional regulator GbsR (MarR family)